MKILLTSDTHTFQDEISQEWLVEADVICHSGDFCLKGTFEEGLAFMEWFKNLPYKHKIFIAGNHDICFDETHNKCSYFRTRHKDYHGKYIEDIRKEVPEGVIYLENSEVVIDGIKFWGSPQTPEFYNWAFNVPRGEAIAEYWNKIPDDVDILLTHGPPHKILDMTAEGDYAGCEELAKAIKRVKPLVNSFGHIHEDRGVQEKEGVLFLNASLVNRQYWVANKPFLIEINENKTVTLL